MRRMVCERLQRKRDEQLAPAQSLVGKAVCFADLLAQDTMHVTDVTDDGMVTLDRFPREFAPHTLRGRRVQ
jgi:hypothetical protein